MTDSLFTVGERRLVLLAACVSGFITPLLSTMMNLSLVSIDAEFAVGSHQLAYVNTAFLLSSVVFMVPLSKAADIFGKKRIYLTGLVVILVACVLAVFSPSFWWLIACRVMMGAGAAAISSTSISLITDVFPGRSRGGAIGVQTMCVYIGLAAGPPLGGALNDLIGWHALFLLVIPLAVASIVCMSFFRHEISPGQGQRMDSAGAALYGIGIVLSMLGVVNMPEAWAFASLAVGLVFMALFVRWQLRIPNYLLNVRLFRSRVFAGSCLAAFLNYAASYSISYFMALYLQSIGAMTATEAGMLMLVQAGVQAFMTPMFGHLSDRIQDKRVLPTTGMVITGFGVSLFMLYGTELDLHLVLATMLIVGFGLGMFSAPNTSVIMGAVRREETSEASGVVAVMRQTGMMVSMGIAMLFISLVMGGSDNLVPENYGLFVDVMHMSFAVCLGMCVVGTLASLLRGRGTTAEVRSRD
ncbi:MAG: MFS transporter [Thermoplasmata archaeon]|nr:MFS transporter [Thermoplasmata archaeon]